MPRDIGEPACPQRGRTAIPVEIRYFESSTCSKSSSTGVARPKIEARPLLLLLLGTNLIETFRKVTLDSR